MIVGGENDALGYPDRRDFRPAALGGGQGAGNHLDADEAAHAFLRICRVHGAKSVVKGKSMVSEELRLNERLAAAGIDPVETDLGEYIVQLADQKPSHVIAPAAHLSAQDVGMLFERKLGLAYTDDPQTLSLAARATRGQAPVVAPGTGGASSAASSYMSRRRLRIFFER